MLTEQEHDFMELCTDVMLYTGLREMYSLVLQWEKQLDFIMHIEICQPGHNFSDDFFCNIQFGYNLWQRISTAVCSWRNMLKCVDDNTRCAKSDVWLSLSDRSTRTWLTGHVTKIWANTFQYPLRDLIPQVNHIKNYSSTKFCSLMECNCQPRKTYKCSHILKCTKLNCIIQKPQRCLVVYKLHVYLKYIIKYSIKLSFLMKSNLKWSFTRYDKRNRLENLVS